MSLYTMPPPSLFSPLSAQTPREVHQNAFILAAVRQHDWRVGLRQPRVWERSKYRCHEHAGRGFTRHQCAVLIPSHLAVGLSPSHGSPAEGALHLIFPSLHQPSVRMVLGDDVAHKNVREGHFFSPHCVVRGHLHTLPTWRSRSDILDLPYIIHIVVCRLFTCVI